MSRSTIVAGSTLLGGVVAGAILGPFAWRASPVNGDLLDRHLGFSRAHPLGTDALGRDQLARVLHGGRLSVSVSVAVVGASMVLAIFVGLTAGYGGGLLGVVLMRVTDALLAFPSLLLAIAVAGVLGPGLRNATLALIAVSWCPVARVVRGEVLSLRSRPFVTAAVSCGATRWRIARRELLPNLAPTLLVLATLDLGTTLLALAGLSYLGLGNAPPTAEWGRMLLDAKPHLERFPLESVVPGASIAITALAFTLLGDGLRDRYAADR